MNGSFFVTMITGRVMHGTVVWGRAAGAGTGVAIVEPKRRDERTKLTVRNCILADREWISKGLLTNVVEIGIQVDSLREMRRKKCQGNTVRLTLFIPFAISLLLMLVYTTARPKPWARLGNVLKCSVHSTRTVYYGPAAGQACSNEDPRRTISNSHRQDIAWLHRFSQFSGVS